MSMSGKITITNQKGPVATIDIEGVIGVAEQWQFEEPGERVATYETFRATVESLKGLRSPEVVVNIRSTGGNVNDALLIYDALTELGARITTRCYGYVASAATVIAQAASPGCREISSNALYLVHRSVCAAEGNSDELSRTLGLLEQTDRRIASVYAARSGKPVEQFAELMCENNGNGRWLSPGEVLSYSLADRIIAAAAVPPDVAQTIANLGLPPVPVPAAAPVPEKTAGSMNFSKRWNAILELLGLREAADEDAAVAASASEDPLVESMAVAQAEMGEAHRQEVAALQNRIDQLEARNARLAAAPTATEPKEDPSHQEVRRDPNEEAYLADVRRFR